MGVQSFCENTLKELGRKHRKEDVFRVVSELKQEGFSNISIDYIYGVHSDIREIKEDINTFLEFKQIEMLENQMKQNPNIEIQTINQIQEQIKGE